MSTVLKVLMMGAMIAMFAVSKAHAADRPLSIVIDAESGKVISALEAIRSGKDAYNCKLAHATVNKSGTGVTLKNDKKKITEEELKKQIEELKKRVEK